MTTRQHLAQKARRQREWNERQNRAAGVSIREVLAAEDLPKVRRPLEVTSEYVRPLRRVQGEARCALVVTYKGGDGRGMATFIGRAANDEAAGADAQAQFAAWKRQQEARS